MTTFSGIPTARGLASGPAFLFRGARDLPVCEYVVEPGREEDELLRMKKAAADVRRDLENLASVLRERGGGPDANVFESHLMMLEDEVMRGEVKRGIMENHLNAEAAVRAAADRARAMFGRMNDPYFRERVRDFEDVERRLLAALAGFHGGVRVELNRPSIVVADDLSPSETVQLPRENVLAFATGGGSATSHVALIARAMGIPAVTGLGDITSAVEPGTTVLLDGTAGTVTVNPDESAVRLFAALADMRREKDLAPADGLPAGTLLDGGDVLIEANVHPGVPVPGLRELGARGVGLYRSEYLWLGRNREPGEDEQFAAYRDAAVAATSLSPGASLTVRVLDIGGDKAVDGISPKEANPFLGNRSIRYLLSRPDVFRTQLRAILRASSYGRVKIMYPMISCVEELDAAAAALADAKRSLDADGIAYDAGVRTGTMIEVPSAALNADALAQKTDFFSIGTNDLVQYTMAADRGNEAVAHLYQPLNTAVMELVGRTISAAHRHGIPVEVCGESASDPVVGVLWAAMGVDGLSMSAAYIPMMSRLLRRLSRADLGEYASLAASFGCGTPAKEVFDRCRAWMLGKVPDLDEIAT